MGHEVPGMRGVYTHITPRMRAELRDTLQTTWEGSLDARARIAGRSAVAVLDQMLSGMTGLTDKARSHVTPETRY